MRDAHADVLWPDGIQPQTVPASSPLRTERRAALPADARPRETESPLIIDPDCIHLDSDAALLDVAEFEHACAAVRDIPGQSLSAGLARGLGTAVELYRGDLMATLYFDWCGYERDRLQLIYLWMLEHSSSSWTTAPPHSSSRRALRRGSLSCGMIRPGKVLIGDGRACTTKRETVPLRYGSTGLAARLPPTGRERLHCASSGLSKRFPDTGTGSWQCGIVS
jgi:hypothetical protein